MSVTSPNLLSAYIYSIEYSGGGGGGGGGGMLQGLNPYPILGKAGLQKHTLF